MLPDRGRRLRVDQRSFRIVAVARFCFLSKCAARLTYTSRVSLPASSLATLSLSSLFRSIRFYPMLLSFPLDVVIRMIFSYVFVIALFGRQRQQDRPSAVPFLKHHKAFYSSTQPLHKIVIIISIINVSHTISPVLTSWN